MKTDVQVLQRCEAGVRAMDALITAQESAYTRLYPWILPTRHDKEKEVLSPYLEPFDDIEDSDGLDVNMRDVRPETSVQAEDEKERLAAQYADLTEREETTALKDLACRTLRVLHDHGFLHIDGLLDLEEDIPLPAHWARPSPASYNFGMLELQQLAGHEDLHHPDMSMETRQRTLRRILRNVDAKSKGIRTLSLARYVEYLLRHVAEELQADASRVCLHILAPKMDAIVAVMRTKEELRDKIHEPLSAEDRADAIKHGYECLKGYVRPMLGHISEYQKQNNDYNFGMYHLRHSLRRLDYFRGFYPTLDRVSGCVIYQVDNARFDKRAGLAIEAIFQHLDSGCRLFWLIQILWEFEDLWSQLGLLQELDCKLEKDNKGYDRIVW